MMARGRGLKRNPGCGLAKESLGLIEEGSAAGQTHGRLPGAAEWAGLDFPDRSGQ
jgi:hypothetical protein